MSKVKLGNRISLEYGFPVRSANEKVGNYPVYGSNGVTGMIDSYKINGPGIIVGRKGSVGKVTFSETNFTPTDTAYYLKLKNENLDDLRFWYYFLPMLGIDKLNTHSAVPGLSRENVYLIEHIIPNKKDQIKISNLLGTLDKKISINNKINSELEAMAKTLYDYWFVQFDFPDENGNPYKSSGGKMEYNSILKREIPLGWEIVPISELLTIKTGKEDANFSVDNGKYHFFTCSEIPLRCEEYAFEGKAILLAGNGTFSVKKFDGKFNAYQRTYVLIPEDNRIFSLLYFIVSDRVKTLTNNSRGSIIKFITKGDIEDINVVIPNNRKLDFFNILNKCLDQSTINYNENLKLIEIRDWLLPMLMNGQVNVS